MQSVLTFVFKMIKSANKTILYFACVSFLTACGGGGDDANSEQQSPQKTYNYSQHDGVYRCAASSTILEFDAKFTSSSASLTLVYPFSAESVSYQDKVGLIEGFPYYSNNIKLTSKAETIFFFNKTLLIVVTPQANVPNLLAEGRTSTTTCTKKA